MGYFAVLAPEGTPKDRLPEVGRCHLNLWSLPGLWPRRLLYLDVGLEISAVSDDIRQFRLLLPFRVEEGRWPGGSTVLQDLYSRVAEQDSAELIFGGPVVIEQSDGPVTIVVGDYPAPVTLVRVHARRCTISDDLEPRPDSTLVNVELHEAIRQGTSAYVRVRFRVFGSAPLWRWKRASGGAQVDFRLYDVRESRFVNEERHLRDLMVHVRTLNIFVMAPSRLVVAARSPEFKYVRRLETGAWRHYLSGASYRGRGDDMSVYYWKQTPKPDAGHPRGRSWAGLWERARTMAGSTPKAADKSKWISSDNPYRVLIELHRPQSRSWLSVVLLTMLGVLLAWGVVRLGGLLLGSDARVDWTVLRGVGAFLVGSSLVAVLGAYERLRGWASGRFLRPRLVFRRVERKALEFKVRG